MIMAAGMGSRYGGLKQLESFGSSGETLLEYSLYDALRAGFTRCIFVIRRDIEALFRGTVINRFDGVIECDVVYQEQDDVPSGFDLNVERQKPWGTGHAVWAARSAISGPFAVINADDFYGRDGLSKLAEFLKEMGTNSRQERCALVGYALENTLSDFGKVARGVCQVDSDDHLKTVVENTGIERTNRGIISRLDGEELSLTGKEIVSMNLWGFGASFFDCLERHFLTFLNSQGHDAKSEFYLPFVVDAELQAGRALVDVLETKSRWFGVTYPNDKAFVRQQVAQLVSEGVYPQKLWSN